MIRYISIALISFLIGVGGMYYLTSMSLNEIDKKHQASLSKELELFKYHNSDVAKNIIDTSNQTIRTTICGVKGDVRDQIVHALILNTMFSSDISKQSLSTIEEVFTTSVIAYIELNRNSTGEVNEALLPLIRNYCNNHVLTVDCEKLDSLIVHMSKELSVCT